MRLFVLALAVAAGCRAEPVAETATDTGSDDETPSSVPLRSAWLRRAPASPRRSRSTTSSR